MRFLIHIPRVLLLLALAWLMPAWAVMVPNMNTADLLVPNRSNAVFRADLPKALSQVLIKQSGNPSIMTLPTVQNALGSIMQLVQSYSYKTVTDNNGNTQLQLHVMFDHRAILHLLRQSGQAIWGSDRPLTLVWLTLSSTDNSDVLSNSMTTPLATQVMQTAKMRGLPILLPMMDLQDQNYTNSNQAQAFDVAKLTAAEKRYGANAILAATVSTGFANAWQAKWLLLLNEQPFAWSNQANTKIALVDAGINKATNMMASQFAMIDNSALQSSVSLEVLGVNNLNDYAHLLCYLNRLSPVSQVSLTNLSGSTALLQVTIVGGQQALVRLLNNGERLAAIPSPLSQGVNRADLYYRYR